MKVLIYTHEFPPFQGGIATSAKKIADIIASKNDLVVCCPSYSLKKKDESSYEIRRIDFPGGKNFKKIPLFQYLIGLSNLKERYSNVALSESSSIGKTLLKTLCNPFC